VVGWCGGGEGEGIYGEGGSGWEEEERDERKEGKVKSRSGWGNRRRSAAGARWMCKGKKEGACGGVIDERGEGE
jgi:hypothetical protein